MLFRSRTVAALVCASVEPPTRERGANLLGVVDAMSSLAVDGLPAALAFGYFFVLEVEGEVGERAEVVVDMLGPDAEQLVQLNVYPLRLRSARLPGRENHLTFAANVEVRVTSQGPHEVRLLVNGAVQASRTLFVRVR